MSIFALQFKDLRRLSCGFLWKDKRQDVGVSEDLQAARRLLADGTVGGVVRIVTISHWFSARVGMTGKCMGSGSISYRCFQIITFILGESELRFKQRSLDLCSKGWGFPKHHLGLFPKIPDFLSQKSRCKAQEFEFEARAPMMMTRKHI